MTEGMVALVSYNKVIFGYYVIDFKFSFLQKSSMSSLLIERLV